MRMRICFAILVCFVLVVHIEGLVRCGAPQIVAKTKLRDRSLGRQVCGYRNQITPLHLRGGDDDDNGEEASEKEDESEEAQEEEEVEEATGGVIPFVEGSDFGQSLSRDSVLWEWWKWRDNHLKEAVILELGLITCPRATFLAGPLLEQSLHTLLRQSVVSSMALRCLVCLVCPKALLLPSLLRDPSGLAAFGLVLLHCFDDTMALITSPAETISSELLHGIGVVALIALYEAMPADPLSALYARQASLLLYLDWGALLYLVISPCVRALSFLTLLFR